MGRKLNNLIMTRGRSTIHEEGRVHQKRVHDRVREQIYTYDQNQTMPYYIQPYQRS
jgi:hypothetical protein